MKSAKIKVEEYRKKRKKSFENILNDVKERIDLILKDKYLKFSEKIKIISNLHKLAMSQKIILKKLVTPKDSPPYFSIGGYKIFFEPDYEVDDRDELLKGITHVISEGLLFPYFFNPQVDLKHGDIVLDIGAFIGLSSMIFSKKVGEKGKVYAIEPVMHNIIKKNVEENNINNTYVIPKAIGNEAGKTEIEISDYGGDASITKREYTKDYYKMKKTIELTTLDLLVKELKLDRIDFIKIDIEGAEELAIRGAYEVIKQFKPKWSISSYHIDFNNEPQHNKLVNLMLEYGYKVKQVDKKHIFAWK
ncbi:MAG: FkbM family methyltransferase [Promethearchaeota archaeon]